MEHKNSMSESNDQDFNNKIPLKMENVNLMDILDLFGDDVEWVDIPNSRLSVKDYRSDKHYKDFDYEVLEMILDVEEDDADFNSYDEIRKRATLIKYNTQQLKKATAHNIEKCFKKDFSLIGDTIYCNKVPYLFKLH
jgi:hypothetical protein